MDGKVKIAAQREDLNQLNLDTNVVSSVQSFVFHGLDPGSFVRKMIDGEIEEAIGAMHALLAPHFIDHYKFIKAVFNPSPPGLKEWEWVGYSNLSDEEQHKFATFAMTTNNELYSMIYNYHTETVRII